MTRDYAAMPKSSAMKCAWPTASLLATGERRAQSRDALARPRRGLNNAFDDAEVPLRRRSQNLQGCLVSSTVVSGERAFKTFELHHDDSLLQTRLPGFEMFSGPNQGLAAAGMYSWNRELAIFFERSLV